MIKAIIFDIDGVLLDSVDANALFFEKMFKSISVKYSRKEYIKLNHLTMWDIIKHFTKEKSEDKIKKIWQAGLEMPYPFDLIVIPKDAVKVVSELSRKFKLGIVTARQKKGVESVLSSCGFRKYIDTIIKFGDYANSKPHPEPLLMALKKLRVKPQEAIYIGDMWSDIACAKSAGVRSVLYKNEYSDLKREKPDYVVSSFKQLLKTINAI